MYDRAKSGEILTTMATSIEKSIKFRGFAYEVRKRGSVLPQGFFILQEADRDIILGSFNRCGVQRSSTTTDRGDSYLSMRRENIIWVSKLGLQRRRNVSYVIVERGRDMKVVKR